MKLVEEMVDEEIDRIKDKLITARDEGKTYIYITLGNREDGFEWTDYHMNRILNGFDTSNFKILSHAINTHQESAGIETRTISEITLLFKLK